MKTPDEIKKGMECCAKGNSCRGHCPYDDRSAGIKECTSQLARDALTLIPSWVSVDERLPEAYKQVLVHVKHNEKNELFSDWECIMTDVFLGDSWADNADSGVHIVTHWMPLPEPPEVTKP